MTTTAYTKGHMLSVLSRVVPPPAYLLLPSIGVDISDTSLKYVSFEATAKSNESKRLKQWGDITIPNGILERGQVLDVRQLASVLEEFKDKTGAEFVNVSLPEERAYLFETEIKRRTPFKEVRSLLEFRLEENVPISSRDVFFDYVILPSEPAAATVRVAVVAYAKEVIQQYYDACIEAKLHPVSFEVESQAVARSVVPGDARGTTMLVDFGKTRTGIGMVHQGHLLYTSTIDIGGEKLSQALRRVIGEETAESELTKLKNTQGLIKGVDSTTIHDALISTVSAIKDEISVRMQYWHTRNGNSDERRISSIVLCGGSANLKGLPAYLTDSLGIPVVLANVWENVFSLSTTVPPIDRPHSYGYATAIGLALKQPG